MPEQDGAGLQCRGDFNVLHHNTYGFTLMFSLSGNPDVVVSRERRWGHDSRDVL